MAIPREGRHLAAVICGLLAAFGAAVVAHGCGGGGGGGGGGGLSASLPERVAPTDPSKIATTSNGLRMQRNQVLIILSSGASNQDEARIVTSINGSVVGRIAEMGLVQVDLPDTGDLSGLTTALSRLRQEPLVKAAGPNHLLRASLAPKSPSDPPWTNNDGKHTKAFDLLGLRTAWAYQVGSRSVKALVVDDGGMNISTAGAVAQGDWANNLLGCVGSEAQIGSSNAGPLYGRDNFRRTFAPDPNNPNGPLKEVNHASLVSNVLCADGDNSRGMAGVCWNLGLVPVVFEELRYDPGIQSNPPLNEGSIAILSARVIGAVTVFHPRLINLSCGLSFASTPGDRAAALADASAQWHADVFTTLLDSILKAEPNAVIVQAAGNGTAPSATSNGGVPYDAAWNGMFSGVTSDHVVVVAALDTTLSRLASFSNYGPNVTIAAPGEAVGTLDFDGNRVQEDGTSFAAPIVTGLAGLILSEKPSLTARELRTALRELTRGRFDPITPSADPTKTGIPVVDAEAFGAWAGKASPRAPKVIAPVAGTTFSGYVSLRWKRVCGATSYLVTVYPSSGTNYVFTALGDPNADEEGLTTSLNPLPGGQYTWSVQAVVSQSQGLISTAAAGPSFSFTPLLNLPPVNPDIDGSGSADLNDYAILKNVFAGETADQQNGNYTTKLIGDFTKRADINGDGAVNDLDLSLMEMQYHFATLSATSDAAIWALQPSTSFGTQTFLDSGVESGSSWRSLVRFTNLGAIQGKTVNKAVLHYYVSGFASSGTRTLELRQVLATWDETVTWNTAPSIGASSVGTGQISGLRYLNDPIDVTSQVNAWKTTPATNFGLALLIQAGLPKVDIVSREGGNPKTRIEVLVSTN